MKKAELLYQLERDVTYVMKTLKLLQVQIDYVKDIEEYKTMDCERLAVEVYSTLKSTSERIDNKILSADKED